MIKVGAVIGAVAVVTFLMSAGYGGFLGKSGMSLHVQGSTVDMSGPPPLLVITTDRQVYLPGEPVNITATFPSGYSGMFPSTVTMYYMILDCNGHVVYKQVVYGLMVITYWSAVPGYSRSFTWNQTDNAGKPIESPKWLEAAIIVPAYFNPLNESSAFEINPMATSFDLSLDYGWNLVSLPLVNDSWSAGSVGLASGSVVAAWNGIAQSYQGTFVVGASPESADFRLVADAYFIWSPLVQSVTLRGCSPTYFSQFTIDLAVPSGGGWACIGFKSLGPGLHASDIAQLVKGSDVTVVCIWDPILSAYRTFIPGATPSAYDFEVGPGEGCWLCLEGPAKLTYSP